MKFFSILIGCFFCLFFFVSSVQAQEAKLETCFLYYDYGKLSAHISASKAQYRNGETIRLAGTIENANTFPVRDIILYAHVKRINEDYATDGHFFIDRMVLTRGLNFLPGETKPVSAEIQIPKTYPNGEYQIQYFLYSQQGFHYGGRPFVEEDTAGVTNISIDGGPSPQVYFNLKTIQLGNNFHNVRGQISEVSTNPVPIQVRVVDTRPAKTTIPVTVKYYYFDDSLESNLVNEETATISPADSTLKLNFSPTHPGAYVVVAHITSPVRSIFKYRFAVAGDAPKELYLNDLGITNYPPSSADKAFVCFHSPNNNLTPQTQVKLSLLDSKKQLVDSTEISGTFDSNVMAISLPLSKVVGEGDFWVRATAGSKNVELHYSCNEFNTSQKDLEISMSSEKQNTLSFKTIGACGKEVQGVNQIDSVRIVKDGEIVKEAYNLKPASREFSLAGLDPGSYTAEIVSGKVSKKMDILIAADGTARQGTRNSNASRNTIIVIIVVLGSAFFYWYKYRRRKHE